MPNLAVDVDSWARSACYPRSTFYPLSDGHSTLGRRITRTDFRPCSACGPRSQAPFYSCAHGTVADRPEGTLRAPPLHFGRRPPQSNYPPGTVHAPDHGRMLGRRHGEGGIPRAAPPGLAPRLRSLPPILYTPYQRPMPSCSEGSRGLSVLPQVIRIFTNNAISPGPRSRQRPSRYAVRAGRNLPDKEFRYLRTVIVTAAVYRGLASPLRLAAWQSPVFLVNSRLGLSTAAPPRSGGELLHAEGRPFSLGYGAIMPSSLTTVLPIASVFSTRPPVSVLVRAAGRCLGVFLGSMGSPASPK